jgi:hypothetical protein
MASELLLGATKILGIFPKPLWFGILIVLCILLIVLYVKYRKQMKA